MLEANIFDPTPKQQEQLDRVHAGEVYIGGRVIHLYDYTRAGGNYSVCPEGHQTRAPFFGPCPSCQMKVVKKVDSSVVH